MSENRTGREMTECGGTLTHVGIERTRKADRRLAEQAALRSIQRLET